MCDLWDLGGIANMAQGMPLMRRIPPTPGKNGRNVRGQVLEHIPGKDVSFTHNLPGTCLAPDDQNLLVAAVSGQPVFVANVVMVDPVLNVKSVDLRIGHLSFDGTITISGDVRGGMILRTTGDINISGVIKNATVQSSSGSVCVAGGIIDLTGATRGCTVSAKENITCLVAEHATLNAGGDIIISGDAIQSTLSSGGAVLVGVDENRGKIVGGTCQARATIRVQVVGSVSGIETRLYMGLDPMVIQRLQSVQERLAEKLASKEELERRRDYFIERELPEEKVLFTQKLIDKATAELTEMISQKKRYQKQTSVIFPSAEIVVARHVYSGVLVNTSVMSIRIEFDREGTVFRCGDEGALVDSVPSAA